MSRLKDITGHRYGRLTVVERVADYDPRGRAAWRCMCDCGKTTTAMGYVLRHGSTVSCGCHKYDLLRKRSLKHGLTKTPEYATWRRMRERCNNPRSPDYYLYGARGISIDVRWSKFLAFLNDMGPRPTPRHSIDRIDNDKGYSPDNCRWATKREQSINRRHVTVYEAFGQRMLLCDWAALFGLSRMCLQRRLDQGVSIAQALCQPKQRCKAYVSKELRNRPRLVVEVHLAKREAAE